jgi:hypothetical protein
MAVIPAFQCDGGRRPMGKFWRVPPACPIGRCEAVTGLKENGSDRKNLCPGNASISPPSSKGGKKITSFQTDKILLYSGVAAPEMAV